VKTSGSSQGRVVDYYEHGNEPSGLQNAIPRLDERLFICQEFCSLELLSM